MQIRYPVLLQDEALYLIRVEEALRQLCIAGEIHKPRAPLGGNENENENEKEDEGSLRKADAWRGDNSGQRVGGREPQRGAVGGGVTPTYGVATVGKHGGSNGTKLEIGEEPAKGTSRDMYRN